MTWTYEDSYRPWEPGDCACGRRATTQCRLCGQESCMRHSSHLCNRCYRTVSVVRQAPEGATGLASIDMQGERPCGGRLNNGKCEFCDVTTIDGETT